MSRPQEIIVDGATYRLVEKPETIWPIALERWVIIVKESSGHRVICKYDLADAMRHAAALAPASLGVLVTKVLASTEGWLR
ncbi:MAG: hypothetical protein ACYDCC_04740 [Actinomycetota bacterium]